MKIKWISDKKAQNGDIMVSLTDLSNQPKGYTMTEPQATAT